MRRLTVTFLYAALAASLILAPAGCKRKRKQQAQSEEPLNGLATMLHTADPRVAPQLVKGFHPVEQNSWRWTMGRFSVVLKPPAGAAQKGAVLQFRFTIPDVIINQLKAVTLSATVNGVSLPPETYSTAGDQTYSRDVPASALTGDSATVDFALDKFLPPGSQDARELGVVASTIGFEAKP